jgi:type VI secretion system protein ImpC
MAQIASAAHAPFISGASPDLLGLDSFRTLNDPPDIKRIFSGKEYIKWSALRDKQYARYVGLTMPHFLARSPYGSGMDRVRVEDFNFEEDVNRDKKNDEDPESSVDSKFVWSNSAYAMAANITRSFRDYGWCTRIVGVESGGLVEGLPVFLTPKMGGGRAVKCPVQVAIPELSRCGLIPFVWKKDDEKAAFFDAQSLYRPKKYEGKDAAYADSNERLNADLSYMFACCRFAQYLKGMLRNKLGQPYEQKELEDYLQLWINSYVLTPENLKAAPPDLKAKKPLAEAKVKVVSIEGEPGAYKATFELRPHYLLKKVEISLNLVSTVKGK